MAQQQTVSGTTTTTLCVGGVTEVTGSTLTKYLVVPGAATYVRVGSGSGSTLSLLGDDGLSSVTEALDVVGNVVARQLYMPYGGVRYSGVMPTTKGFSGQRQDATTGLSYFVARYYNPVLGQFVSGDDVLPGQGYNLWGLSRYAYVAGNPETKTDPTGHCWFACSIFRGDLGGERGGRRRCRARRTCGT